MAFEFFFGIFGLISSDSKSRHKSRLESEWRLSTPLNANLFREAGLKSPLAGSGPSPVYGFKGSPGGDLQRPIFSTTGTLGAVNNSNNSVSEGLFSSASSSSASSIASSGSVSTANSSAAFIKPETKKYEKFAGAASNHSSSGLGGLLTSSSASGSASASANTHSDHLAGLKSARGLMDGGVDSPTGGALDGADPSADTDGLEPTSGGQATGAAGSPVSRAKRLRSFYCVMVCVCLWLHVLRLLVGLLVEKSLVTLDFYCLGAYRIHFLIPALCLAIQAAAVSLIFIRNNDETNWLVPFYSSKDYLIRSRSNFKPKIEDYTRRVNISVALALVLALISSISLSTYLIHCVSQSDMMLMSSAAAHKSSSSSGGGGGGSTSTTALAGPQPPAAGAGAGAGANNKQQTGEISQMERMVLAGLLLMDVGWAIYSTYICFLVSFYFNLICSIMKSRFHGISKIIEDLAESNTTKTTNQARKITTLYLEHNEACELLDESNDFWQYLIFFTYFTYIPAYCYCLYNLFFVDFEAWPSFITWVIHTHTGFIILLISFSAAGVSTEAHAPYTSLHTLSLIQLPLDVEVNIATFLHRVRGLTIGYSCYDLFAITNASMSNTAAACASYFLIVADFSRSSVFTLAQMNGSSPASASASAAPTTPAPIR